jgi:enamine deaminase RidA (YjgF/YER057c/UK114 family)
MWIMTDLPASDGVRLIRNTDLAPVAEYAYAAVAEAPVRAIWTAGACPLDAAGNTVAIGDYAGQAEQVMRNLVTALESAGASLTDVVKTTVYVASSRQEDLVAAWEVVRDHMGEHDAPSTLLGVSVLGYHDQLVEVEAVAVLIEEPITGDPAEG